MFKMTYLIAFLVLASGFVWAQESLMPSVVIKNDEAGVQKLMDDFVAAWNKHDPKVMAALWLPEGDLINPWGKLAEGRDLVEKLFVEEQSGPLKLVSMQMHVNHVRFVTFKVALVDATVFLDGPLDAETRKLIPFEQHAVFLVTEEKEGWRIAAARPYVLLGPIDQMKK